MRKFHSIAALCATVSVPNCERCSTGSPSIHIGQRPVFRRDVCIRTSAHLVRGTPSHETLNERPSCGNQWRELSIDLAAGPTISSGSGETDVRLSQRRIAGSVQSNRIDSVPTSSLLVSHV